MQVGFVGVGQMGRPIAERLLRTGIGVTVYDLRPEATAALVDAGAVFVHSPAEIAAHCSIVFGCVASVTDFRDVVHGPLGLCSGGSTLQYYVHLGTTGSACVRELATALAQRGVTTVDAPITGGPQRAREGTLTTMVSGLPEAFRLVEGLMRAYSSTVVHLADEPGAAQVMKVINNGLSRVNWAAACEAMIMGAKAGLDPDRMLEVLNHGSGQNNATSTKIPMALVDRPFGAALQISEKDLKLWREEVDRLDLRCAIGDCVEDLYARVFQQAKPTDDVLSLLTHLERWAGTRVPRKSRRPLDLA